MGSPLWGSDAYFITGSREYKNPDYLLEYFAYIENPEIIKIYKGKRARPEFLCLPFAPLLAVAPDLLDVLGITQPAGFMHFSPTLNII